MNQLKGMISGKKYRRLFIQSLIILLPVFSFAQTDKNHFEVYGFILTDGRLQF